MAPKTPTAERSDDAMFDVPDEAGLLEAPEAEATERVYRPPVFRVEQLPIDRINVCSQHRNGSNPVQRELNSSIARRGLGNAMMVTILDRPRMEEYVAFTNRVWGSEAGIDDFVPFDDSGETYALMVAGHSRLEGCRAHAEQLGCGPDRYFEHARILEVDTIDEIVAWQTEENIHSAPAPQNTARLLAEAWFWQKEQEAAGAETVTRREFAKGHQVGEQALRDALNYIQLPPDVRGLTDDGVLPYSIAVEVGRSIGVVRDWAELKDPDSADELHRTELLRLATCYLRSEKILMARQEIRARVEGYRETLGADEGTEQPPLEDFMSLVEEPSAAEMARRQLEAELKEVHGRMQRGHLSLQNRIAELAGIEGVGITEAHTAEIVEEGFELLEDEPRDDEPQADGQGELREGETVQVG